MSALAFASHAYLSKDSDPTFLNSLVHHSVKPEEIDLSDLPSEYRASGMGIRGMIFPTREQSEVINLSDIASYIAYALESKAEEISLHCTKEELLFSPDPFLTVRLHVEYLASGCSKSEIVFFRVVPVPNKRTPKAIAR